MLGALALLLIVTAVAAVGLTVAWLARREHEHQPPAPRAAPPPAGEAGVRTLIDTTPEVALLFERLGGSIPVERRVEGLLDRLRDLLGARVPDPRALLSALEKGTMERPDDPPTLAEARRAKARDPLLSELLAVGCDRARLEEVLAREPLRAVPFVEQVPLAGRGRVTWRSPAEVHRVLRRPRDPAAFAGAVEDLRALISDRVLDRPQEAVDAVLAAAGRLLRDLPREHSYLPRGIVELEEAALRWLWGSQPPAVRVERERLLALLALLARARHLQGSGEYGFMEAGRLPPAKLLDAARRYLETPWMHCSWLSNELLAQILHAGLPDLPGPEPRPVWQRRQEQPLSPREIVALSRDEIASGLFDRDEVRRRLAALESRGVVLPSLVPALLRVSGEAARRARMA